MLLLLLPVSIPIWVPVALAPGTDNFSLPSIFTCPSQPHSLAYTGVYKQAHCISTNQIHNPWYSRSYLSTLILILFSFAFSHIASLLQTFPGAFPCSPHSIMYYLVKWEREKRTFQHFSAASVAWDLKSPSPGLINLALLWLLAHFLSAAMAFLLSLSMFFFLHVAGLHEFFFEGANRKSPFLFFFLSLITCKTRFHPLTLIFVALCH